MLVRVLSRVVCAIGVAACLGPDLAHAHGVAGGDQRFIEGVAGSQIVPFMYLGAKHMVTGYDHLLFLVGVIFFLYRMRDVLLYVSLFSLGHSLTLLFGVLSGAHVDPYAIDAIIGLSVVYKGLDNLGALRRWLGFQPDARAAVLVFGLCHGFGLATKLQDFSLSPDGLVGNIVSFNVGVEIGQILALALVLIGMGFWRRTEAFARHARAVNVGLVVAGLTLAAYQVSGYFGVQFGGTP
jgi:hypothetical protein